MKLLELRQGPAPLKRAPGGRLTLEILSAISRWRGDFCAFCAASPSVFAVFMIGTAFLPKTFAHLRKKDAQAKLAEHGAAMAQL
ncbi:MAG: hypothetical protein PUI29_03965 [Aeromonadales bacterium]|nr:hypothetical protein [Aeromonadales bacterium]MDY2892141.1 hypothetical protein [Succinivibrio sp.]